MPFRLLDVCRGAEYGHGRESCSISDIYREYEPNIRKIMLLKESRRGEESDGQSGGGERCIKATGAGGIHTRNRISPPSRGWCLVCNRRRCHEGEEMVDKRTDGESGGCAACCAENKNGCLIRASRRSPLAVQQTRSALQTNTTDPRGIMNKSNTTSAPEPLQFGAPDR